MHGGPGCGNFAFQRDIFCFAKHGNVKGRISENEIVLRR